MRKRHRTEDEAEINITPMLDIVFIMLIFFIVTTSFVREQGLDISRPTQAEEQQQQDEDNLPILVRINQLSMISVNNRQVEADAVRANLERERAQNPSSPLIIAAHPDADTNSLVRVLDAANVVGIASISVATETGGR
ncbi:ExbD/TolR family protein [Wenzhouxiangella marina]|uniref:ExbD2 protein n=1 Tax=Wenzhouxiangella marina TaxID=1579979 RepID=A0A0K0XZ23_9GAMM|nr:biopolymer transporter ExbD [Wenzhouxiangella marina]AKS42938.1 ExbD2 protein [Wenzhouxiangella marina]MBB6087378.1 biopolymer transport protein ExbD [Wenzhouxiangella marina]